MNNLFDTFKEAIDTATTHMSKYKKAAKEYTDKVDTGLDTLAELIKRLKACIKQLVELQDNYISYIQRITQIRENMEIMLNKEITKAQSNSGKECDKQISELLKQFQGFVQTIGTWEKEGTRFETLLTELKTEIDALCKKAEQIMKQNEGNTGGLEREISELEEKLNPGSSSSKEEDDIRESKEGETSVRAQARALERGDIEQYGQISRARESSQQSSRERTAERRSIAGYNQGGGWRSPSNSIPYGTPVRSVNIKYNKTIKKKEKKQKNKKKRGTLKKKKKKKQSRRKRRKGRKGKRN
jgi:chromosome segregation ATPase